MLPFPVQVGKDFLEKTENDGKSVLDYDMEASAWVGMNPPRKSTTVWSDLVHCGWIKETRRG